MIRTANSGDEPALRTLQSHLRDPNPPLLDYAVDGPPLVLVSTAARAAVETSTSEQSANPSVRRDDLAEAASRPRDPVGYLVAFHDGATGYVAELVVAPAFRRQGRARRLLAAAFERLGEAGCERVRLAVHPDSEPARRLYASVGFEQIGREPDHYGDGSDALLLEKGL